MYKVKFTLMNIYLLLYTPYAKVFTDIFVYVFGRDTKYFFLGVPKFNGVCVAGKLPPS